MTEEAVDPLLVIVGPTGTGKSTLAARLASRCGGEVVSADSVQVYRHFDVGSGKPTEEERELAPHHLIDIIDPLDQMEASVWAERAAGVIQEIKDRGRVPIVCGGTFLWVRALLFGLADAPPGDEGIRERHRKEAADRGREKLHEELARIDPASAVRLHPNDLVRVSRALEVHELTGRTLSEIQGEHGFRKPKYAAQLLAVDWERNDYDARLTARVRAMVDSGWKDEVRGLLERGYGGARAMDAVGYKQVKDAVTGAPQASEGHGGSDQVESDQAESDQVEMDDTELAASITRVTRVFARRQRTWLRDEPVRYVSATTLSDEGALQQLHRELSPTLP